MEVINFKTGRTYDTAQVLKITVLADHIGESGLRDVIATFIDASRHIDGRVELALFEGESIGKAVLEAYDAGRYTSI